MGYERSEMDWDAYVSDLSVCGAVAHMHTQVEELMEGSIELYLEGTRENELPMPDWW